MLGSGPPAWAYAAGFAAEGARVRLWASSGDEATRLQSSGISVRDEGPVGNYRVDPDADHAIRPVAWIDQAVQGAHLVVVVGAVAHQRATAMRLAGVLEEGQTVAVSPGGTFGVLEMAWWLRAGGSNPGVTLVELQSCPFAVEAAGFGRLRWSPPTAEPGLATYPAEQGRSVQESLADYFPGTQLQPTVLHTSLTESSWAAAPAALLDGPLARLEPERLLPGATPLPRPPAPSSQMKSLIEALAEERATVAARWGVRTPQAAIGDFPPGGPDAQDTVAGVLDGTIGSLTPLCSAAALASVPVPVTSAVVTLVSVMCGRDLWAEGRRLEGLGWGGADLDAVRRAVGRAE